MLFETPLTEAEKCSGQHMTREATDAFFAPREHVVEVAAVPATTTTTSLPHPKQSTTNAVAADELHGGVTAAMNDPMFVESHKSSTAPLAMLAFAKVVMKSIVHDKQINTLSHFDGMSITVPSLNKFMEPHYHSIAGQKLLCVDWKRMYNLEIPCLRCNRGVLKNDRTNFSKNKILFPIFMLEGPPQWAMVQSMVCGSCKWRVDANDRELLATIPPYARQGYPVETKYAVNKNCHLGRSTTDVMDLLMPTHGNGDLISRMLYNAINRAYIERIQHYYSSYKLHKKEGIPICYIEKDGQYITNYPPLGDGIRDTYDLAASSKNTPWKLSDHDRHTREIQSVGCSLIFAQDHTHEVTKNYFEKKSLGAVALWDCANENGEIACAALVQSTKTKDFAHAAGGLARRLTFKPTGMCSDTWPNKAGFWDLLFKDLEGRLGLFHYTQRMTKTLKKKHVDHCVAITRLTNCIYHYNVHDYENLLKALREGTLSAKCTDSEINDLKNTRVFKQRYDKYLRKEIRPPHVMCAMLDDWFDAFKCTSSGSDPSRPARGRKDPVSGDTLFSADTKDAVTECKKKASYLQDPLPLKDMYDTIPPSPNSTHQLNECLSRRGESCLESFHLMLAHFGNCGMRTSMADNLNLTGTAQYNLSIRHKRYLLTLQNRQRKKTPAAFESIVPFFNHTELQCVNQLVAHAGMTKVPFERVEPLPPDNGERFFSECLKLMKDAKPGTDLQDRCCCELCSLQPAHKSQQQQATAKEIITHHADNAPITTTTTTTTTTINATTEASQINNFAKSPPAPTPAMVQLPAVQPQKQVPHVQVHHQQCNPRQAVMLQQHPHAHQHQQHLHHQQQQQQFAYMPVYPPIPQLQPWTMTAYPAAAIYCCGRYQHWHNRPNRRGRPPHDDHCRRSSVEKGGKIDYNPSCRLI